MRYGALPTGAIYDAAYQGAVQANQVAIIPSTTTGIYYVLVQGQSEPGANTRVTLLAHLLPFGITGKAQTEFDIRWPPSNASSGGVPVSPVK